MKWRSHLSKRKLDSLVKQKEYCKSQKEMLTVERDFLLKDRLNLLALQSNLERKLKQKPKLKR